VWYEMRTLPRGVNAHAIVGLADTAGDSSLWWATCRLVLTWLLEDPSGSLPDVPVGHSPVYGQTPRSAGKGALRSRSVANSTTNSASCCNS
jgi:hypothetical protein